MSGEKKLPSKEEIDAVLSGWSFDRGTSPGGSEPATPTAAPDPAPAALVKTLDAAMTRIAQLEIGLTETNSAVRLIHQNMQTMTGQVQVVSSRVKGILSNLKATLGYRAKNTSVGVSCRSRGKVAARVKGTHCGQDNLWGWWPS